MPKKKRNRFSLPEIVAILRLHLLERTPISDLCDQHGVHPTMFYRWQKQFFENGAAAFELHRRRTGDDKDRTITLLRQKLQRKNEVLSALMEAHITLTRRSRNQKAVHYHDGAINHKTPFAASVSALFALHY
jgi:transposase